MTYSEAAEQRTFIVNEDLREIKQFNPNLNRWETVGWAEAGVRSQDGGHDEDSMTYEDVVICLEDRSDEFENEVTFVNESEITMEADPDVKLIPADPKQCQHQHLEGSFMTLGPRKLIRCKQVPSVIVREKVPAIHAEDGLLGEMSLCPDHLDVLRRRQGLAEFEIIKLKSVMRNAEYPLKHELRVLRDWEPANNDSEEE